MARLRIGGGFSGNSLEERRKIRLEVAAVCEASFGVDGEFEFEESPRPAFALRPRLPTKLRRARIARRVLSLTFSRQVEGIEDLPEGGQ